MTTYPLSEPATVHAGDDTGRAGAGVLGNGTLADCVEIVSGLGGEARSSARIAMDDLDLEFGPEEIDELATFLRNEEPGLTNKDIADIADTIE